MGLADFIFEHIGIISAVWKIVTFIVIVGIVYHILSRLDDLEKSVRVRAVGSELDIARKDLALLGKKIETNSESVHKLSSRTEDLGLKANLVAAAIKDHGRALSHKANASSVRSITDNVKHLDEAVFGDFVRLEKDRKVPRPELTHKNSGVIKVINSQQHTIKELSSKIVDLECEIFILKETAKMPPLKQCEKQ